MISKAITESKKVVEGIDPYKPQMTITPPVDYLKNQFKGFDLTNSDEHNDCDDHTNMKRYISACYINGLVRNHSEKAFIACQGPVA